jgi:uncharacterized membrane protein YfcA
MSHAVTGQTTRGRALVFAALFLLVVVVIVALLDQSADQGAELVRNHILSRIRTSAFPTTPMTAVALVGIGLAVGTLGGMIGMGGGVMQVAGLLLVFRTDIYFARTVAMATMFFAAISAIQRYPAPARFQVRSLQSMFAPALGGTLAGVVLGYFLQGATLTHFFGIFVLFLSLYTLALLLGDPDEVALRQQLRKGVHPWQHGAARIVGLLHGFFCGLLGISGGVITTPLQQIFLNVPVHNAVASSLRLTAVCSGLGSIFVMGWGMSRGDFQPRQLIFVLLCVGIGSIVGAQFGARASGMVNSAFLRLVFVLVSLCAGFSILL